MDWITLLGLLAGVFTTISFLPQVIYTWRRKSAKDISLGMFLLFCTGILLWIIYGMMLNNIPIIATNVATFSLAFMILVFKVKYG
jgi:MtN3 and saliva related transmembrane protein